MRYPIYRLGLVVGLAVLVTACGGSAATPGPTAPASLPGTSWTLGVQAGSAPAAQKLPTMTFGTDGTVTGWGGCATYTGSFTVTGSSISITQVAPDRISATCAPETTAAQTAFLAGLAGATSWETVTDATPTANPPGVKVLVPVKLVLKGSVTQYFTLG
jgi:putative lipoprotein